MQEIKEGDLIINVLSLVPEESFSPVQMQKLFFLLEKRLGIGNFDFKAHHYGPYSRYLSAVLDFHDKLEVININGITHYKIKESEIISDSNFLDENKRKFVVEMVKFVKSLSFKQLCMAIYKEFPDMAVNSIFFKK